MKHKPRLPAQWIVLGFTFALVGAGSLLIYLDGPLSSLISLFIVPIVIVAFFYPRWVYVSMSAVTFFMGFIIAAHLSKEASTMRWGTSFGVIAAVMLAETVYRLQQARRSSEARRQESEEKFRRLVEQSPNGIVLTNERGAVVTWNPAMQALTGVSARDAIGRKIWDVQFQMATGEQKKPEILTYVRQLTEQLLRGDIAWPDHASERPFLCPNGEERIMQSVIFPLETSQGTVLASINRDVTERRRLEAQLQAYTVHLEQRVEEKVQELEVERSKVVQSAKLAALGELATGIAHELNQPLTAISFDADYLKTAAQRENITLDRAEIQEIGENLLEDVARCRRIIDHLRTFARIPEKQSQRIDLNQPIQDSFILTGERLRLHGVHVQTQLDPELPFIAANPYKLEQVFLNLLSNAEYALETMQRRIDNGEATRSNYEKKLTIRTWATDEHVFAEVKDNGCGIPQALQARMFQPFFTTKPVGKGTGVGLSISQDLVIEAGGEIMFESEENVGTSFTLSFPVARQDA